MDFEDKLVSGVEKAFRKYQDACFHLLTLFTTAINDWLTGALADMPAEWRPSWDRFVQDWSDQGVELQDSWKEYFKGGLTEQEQKARDAQLLRAIVRANIREPVDPRVATDTTPFRTDVDLAGSARLTDEFGTIYTEERYHPHLGSTGEREPGPGRWRREIVAERHDSITGSITRTVRWTPLDLRARRWKAEQHLLEEYDKTVKAQIALALAVYRGKLVTWKELDAAAKNPSSGVRVVENPNTTFGVKRAGYSAFIQDIAIAQDEFKLVWGRVSRPNHSGELVAAVIDVAHLPSGPETDMAAAKPYFDHIEDSFRSARIKFAIEAALLALDAGTIAFGSIKQITFLSRTVRVYRVEGIANTRILIGEGGEVLITGEKTLFLNFGSRARAEEYLAQKLAKGLAGAEIKSFKVPRAFLDDLRQAAVDENLAAIKSTRPFVVDITKAPDQFGLRKPQIEALRKAIIQGSGKKGR